MDSEEFYSVFDEGLNYYRVDLTRALDSVKVDHFRSFVGNRMYVASESVIDIEGLVPIEAPVVPTQEPEDPFEEVAAEDQPDQSPAQ